MPNPAKRQQRGYGTWRIPATPPVKSNNEDALEIYKIYIYIFFIQGSHHGGIPPKKKLEEFTGPRATVYSLFNIYFDFHFKKKSFTAFGC